MQEADFLLHKRVVASRPLRILFRVRGQQTLKAFQMLGNPTVAMLHAIQEPVWAHTASNCCGASTPKTTKSLQLNIVGHKTTPKDAMYYVNSRVNSDQKQTQKSSDSNIISCNGGGERNDLRHLPSPRGPPSSAPRNRSASRPAWPPPAPLIGPPSQPLHR